MTSSPFFSCLRASAAFILDFLFLAVAEAFKLGAERTFLLAVIAFSFDWFTFESPLETDDPIHLSPRWGLIYSGTVSYTPIAPLGLDF